MKFIYRRLVQYYAQNKEIKGPKTIVDPQKMRILNSKKLYHAANKSLPSASNKNMLITSALPYVNNTPHLGNIIGAVLSADVYARFCRLMGHNVLFICGTDEYGTATEVKARLEKTTPQQICDKFHHIHKSIYEWFDISFDFFGRTSTAVHAQITQQIFAQNYQNGNIIQKQSEQLYCAHCDLFLADRFVYGNCNKCSSVTRGDQCQNCSIVFSNLNDDLTNLKCSICHNPPTLKPTTHLYLKLNDQRNNLTTWMNQNTMSQKWSNNAKGVTKGWLNCSSPDRCITRDLKWGIPVPLKGYQKKVFYVWFEAPLGYISITAQFLGDNYKAWWIKNSNISVELTQFMGKDNILFHSIICPATLLGTNTNWQLPTFLSVTEYLKYEGGKFSKSHNIGVFGDQCQKTQICSEIWRYYLLRNRPQSFDSEFSWSDFASKTNKQMVNSIGNLVHRVLKYTFKEYGSTILPLSQAELLADQLALIQQFSSKFKEFKQAMEGVQILKGAGMIHEFSFLLNQYISKTEFWRNKQRKAIILAFLVRIIKVYSFFIEPFMPSLTAKIEYLLGCPIQAHEGKYLELADMKKAIITSLNNSKGLQQPIPLYRQITDDDISNYKSKFGS